MEIPVPGTLHRLSRQGTMSWRVSRLRRLDPLDSLGLIYGDYFDPAKPLVEVTTHWDGQDWKALGYPERIPAGGPPPYLPRRTAPSGGPG
jgi:hypothetical protein